MKDNSIRTNIILTPESKAAGQRLIGDLGGNLSEVIRRTLIEADNQLNPGAAVAAEDTSRRKRPEKEIRFISTVTG